MTDLIRSKLPLTAAVSSVIFLLGITSAGTWFLANTLSGIRADLEKQAVEMRLLRLDFNQHTTNAPREYFTRAEAAQHHYDLEKVLQRAGLKVDFPPPTSPAIR